MRLMEEKNVYHEPDVKLATVPCKKTRHEILQSDILAILTTFQIEL